MNALLRPGVIARGDRRLQIDQTDIRGEALQHIQRITPDVVEPYRCGDGTGYRLGQLHILAGIANLRLKQAWTPRVR
jgi:hypothetical protein